MSIYLFFWTDVSVAKDFELESKPLYEFGMGGGGGYLSDYPASDQSHWRGLPFPYFIYRGAIFKTDRRRGTRAKILSTQTYEFALSGSGSFPAHSDENTARNGMPDLDWIWEIGPRLIVELGDPNWMWHPSVHIPVRTVFSTDLSSMQSQGFSLTPSFKIERYDLFHRNSRLSLELTLNFMDQTLGKYFYEVNTNYVRVDRPLYMAKAGYMGTDFQIAFVHPIGESVRTFSGLNVSYFGGSVNDNSPLFRSLWGIDVSIGLIWVIGKSKELVKGEDHD